MKDKYKTITLGDITKVITRVLLILVVSAIIGAIGYAMYYFMDVFDWILLGCIFAVIVIAVVVGAIYDWVIENENKVIFKWKNNTVTEKPWLKKKKNKLNK